MYPGEYEQQITNYMVGFYACLGILAIASVLAVFLFFRFRITRVFSILSGREKRKALSKLSVLILTAAIFGFSGTVLAETQNPDKPVSESLNPEEEQVSDSPNPEEEQVSDISNPEEERISDSPNPGDENLLCLSGAKPAGENYYTSSASPEIVLSYTGAGICPSMVQCEGEVEIKDSKITVQYNSLPDGEHSIEVCRSSFTFIVDTTPPEVSVLQTNRDYNGTDGTMDYYAKETDFIITVSDQNPDPEHMSFSCQLDGEDREIILLPKGESGEDRFTWTGSLTLDDPEENKKTAGDTLRAITGEVFDLAGNPVKKVSNQTNLSFLVKDGIIQTGSSGHLIRIDKTAPSIRIESPDPDLSANACGNVYYYKTHQTVKVILTDWNLQPEGSKILYTMTENGNPQDYSVNCSSSFWVQKEDGVYIMEIPIEDGQELSGLRVAAKDYAKHSATDSTIRDFCYITDSSPPAVQIDVTGDGIDSFFTNGTDVYVKFARTAAAESGRKASGPAQTVTLHIAVTDLNIETLLSADYKKSFFVRNELANDVRWEGKTLRNQVSTITYKQSVTVPPEKSGELLFRITVTDLAGNAAEDFSTNLPEAVKGKIRMNSKGRITGKVIADRERPSSEKDCQNTPIIRLEADTSPAGILEDQVLLYSKSLNYQLTVTDPVYIDSQGKRQFSGLASVFWTVESDQPELIGTYGNELLFSGEESADILIPVIINGTGESDDITLKVTVTDRAGNTTTYEQKLAMDNEKPRVSVVYENQEVRNGRFFRASRTAEVIIRDLNFDPAGTGIRTQGDISEWEHCGSGHTVTIHYTEDGDYTLEITAIDRAQNSAEIDYTNGGTNAASQDFTIDTTKPVIGIAFDNNDAANGKYYNKGRTATITVEEKHFSKEEVAAAFAAFLDGEEQTPPTINQDWTDDGDSHFAAVSFLEEGDYSGTVRCTDLAGNEADVRVIETFTVDKTPPTAQLTGIRYGEARSDSVTPHLRFLDRNFDKKNYRFAWTRTDQLTRTKDLLAEYPPVQEEILRGNVLQGYELYFENPDQTRRENDGIYRLSAMITDLAGNSACLTDEMGNPYQDGIMYSLNRFGSAYDVPDTTEDFRKTGALLENHYANEAQAVTVRETNPNVLKNQQVTLAVNGSIHTLTKGVDYEIEQVSKKDMAWKQVVYHIFKSAFQDTSGALLQGEYTITLYSEDAAGNVNSNRSGSRENRLELAFVLDNEQPTGYVSVKGLAEGKDSIKAGQTAVDYYWEDNNGVAEAELYLNGRQIRKATEEELGAGTAQLQISESNELQNAYAVITDLAGNQTQLEEVRFYLNSNGLRQLLRKPLLPMCITAVVLAGLLALKIFLTIKRRRNSKSGQS